MKLRDDPYATEYMIADFVVGAILGIPMALISSLIYRLYKLPLLDGIVIFILVVAMGDLFDALKFGLKVYSNKYARVNLVKLIYGTLALWYLMPK